MKKEFNKVVLKGIRPDQSLLRFLDRQIRNKIHREQSLLFLPNDSSYFVQLEEKKSSRVVNCLLRIRIGSREWFGQENGETAQDGIRLALRHLQMAPVF